VPERDIEARAGRDDLHVRGDQRLAAVYRDPHRLAEHRMNARAPCSVSPSRPTSDPLPCEGHIRVCAAAVTKLANLAVFATRPHPHPGPVVEAGPKPYGFPGPFPRR
jgi:hypothetical protein